MAPPALLRAGDTITWIEPASTDQAGNAATSGTWSAVTYLRFNASGEGVTISGSARTDGGWDFSISASTSGGMDAGTWYWQTQISSGSTTLTIGAGTLTVEPSLAYTGSAAAFDGRSQAEQDLEAVQAAIRALISKGARQYSIGSRQFTSLDIPALMQREAQLKAVVARERAAEKLAAGLGHPGRVFVRFT